MPGLQSCGGCAHLAASEGRATGRRGSTAVPRDGAMSRTLRQLMPWGCGVSGGEHPRSEHGQGCARSRGSVGQRRLPSTAPLCPGSRDSDTAKLTRAAGVKLPRQRSPGSSSRQPLDHHRVAAARAVLRQPELGDGAIEPQPLHLQHAAVPCVPGRDAQLRTGDTAGMQQLPPARREGKPALPCACPGWERLRRGTGRSLSPMRGPQSREEERRNLEPTLGMCEQQPL